MPDNLEQELQDSLTPASDGEAVKQPSVEPAPMVPKSDVDKLYARMKQAEENERKFKDELADLKARPASATVPEDIYQELKVNRLMTQGYNEEESKFILKAGGLENPYVKAGVEALRGKSRVEQAQPGASQVATPSSQLATPIHKMNPGDKAKAWREALDKAAAKRAGQVV